MTAAHDDPYAVHSLIETPGADAVHGRVRWDPLHSAWNGGMMLVGVGLAPFTFSWGALALFLVLTGGFILLGHSVGFHRRLIHGSFKSPLWLDRLLIWCGAMVGMSGPQWMVHTHDLRDWAQRREDCHPYLRHGGSLLRDGVWQMHCRLELDRPPRFKPLEDRFHRFLEASWMAQQIPLAVLLYLWGGLGFVVWGVCLRIFAGVFGHWLVGHLAHRRGPQTWLVGGAGVQAHNVPWAAIPTMGEAWHNNHHAYPASARIGLYPGQSDWGFAFIKLLERLGLAWDIQTPESLPMRPALQAVKGPPAYPPQPVRPYPARHALFRHVPIVGRCPHPDSRRCGRARPRARFH